MTWRVKETVAAYHHYSFIVPVFFKQRLTVRKETLIRQAIILKYNCLLNLIEHPIYASFRSTLTTEVEVRVVFIDTTIPVDHFINQLPDLNTTSSIARYVRPGSVSDDKKVSWFDLLENLKNLRCAVRSIKNYDGYRCIQVCTPADGR